MIENIDPIVPEGTPLPTPPVGVPPYPITPFAVWTWDSPVIPSFYWNIYSAEQRVKMICKEIGKIEAYLNYLGNKTNENLIDLQKQITVLDTRLTALEKKLADEVARLDALIAKLREDLTAETKAREDGDTALDTRITTESNKLHGEISTETQNRIHADDSLHNEISTEVQARQDADSALEAKLTTEISKRLLPSEVTAGDEISITQPDPNSNIIVIASTVAHSIADLKDSVAGLKAALDSETSERRAEDTKLWQAVNQRIERGKILAGTGISVVNDPDSTTVTISSTGGTGGITPIKGVAPVLVLPNEETGGYSIGVEAATELTAGVITEARVKELAPKATTTTVAGTAPVTVTGTPEAGYTIGATPATASAPGVVKIGSGVSVTADGTISVAAGGLQTETITITQADSSNELNNWTVNPGTLHFYRYGDLLAARGYFSLKPTADFQGSITTNDLHFRLSSHVSNGFTTDYGLKTMAFVSTSDGYLMRDVIAAKPLWFSFPENLQSVSVEIPGLDLKANTTYFFTVDALSIYFGDNAGNENG